MSSSLQRPSTAHVEYKQGACHIIRGDVVISAAPASGTFLFRSEVTWPAESCAHSVRKGIIAALTDAGFDSDFAAHFVLKEIRWHEIDSCEAGFYNAAKLAAAQILEGAGDSRLMLATPKSLDASGGSVFRNLIRPAILD